MNKPDRTKHGRHLWLWVCLAIAALAVATLFVLRQRSPSGPRLLNEPTKAREVRPFSTEPDPRFAPLPIEPEKHGK
jgi:hypothetical protein